MRGLNVEEDWGSCYGWVNRWQRMYSSFNTYSSMPKGGWVLQSNAHDMPNMPILMMHANTHDFAAQLP